MSCKSPLRGWRARKVELSGKRKITFDQSAAYTDMPIELPCGQCIGCRLERSRQWAMRCVHEASLHDENCYVTLTYDDKNLPDHGGLVLEDHQLYIKRLRQRLFREKGERVKIKYFLCAEYGDQTFRPHYHVLIFGYDYPDRTFLKKNAQGDNLYISELCKNDWKLGNVIIGNLTFESAAYCARYVLKKVLGDGKNYYEKIDSDTGEIIKIKKEYATMSRNPGIGKDWITAFKSDAYPSDFIVIRGKKMKPAKYYDRVIEEIDNDLYLKVKAKRKREQSNKTLESPYQLYISEECLKSRIKSLKRTLEN